jgi:ribonuclease P protein subunit POP4
VLPVHRQWQQYIHNLVHPAQNLKEAQQLAFNADLHGCFLRVTQAPEPRHIGQRGIVVRNTRNAFFLVTPDDRIMMIPKQNCVFEFAIDGKRVVTLLGSGLLNNAEAGNGGGGGGGGSAAGKKKAGGNKNKK